MVCSAVLVLASRERNRLPASLDITVGSGGDFSGRLNRRGPGTPYSSAPGGIYTGSYVLEGRSGSDTRPVIVRTAGSDAVPPGERMTPEAARASRSSARRTSCRRSRPSRARASGGSSSSSSWQIATAPATSSRSATDRPRRRSWPRVPSDLVLDRVYIHGDAVVGQKRGIALNAGRTSITNSHISDIKAIGQDSQAIAGWNGPGRLSSSRTTISRRPARTSCSAARIRRSCGLTPADIAIRGNTVQKPLAWRSRACTGRSRICSSSRTRGTWWSSDNLFEHNWAEAAIRVRGAVHGPQPGRRLSVVHTREQSSSSGTSSATSRPRSRCWAPITTAQSRQTSGIVIQRQRVRRLDSRAWGGDGYLLQMTDRPRYVASITTPSSRGLERRHPRSTGRVDGFVVHEQPHRPRRVRHHREQHGAGNDSIRTAFPGRRVARNVLAGGESRLYPPDNLFPSMQEFRRQFVDFDGATSGSCPTVRGRAPEPTGAPWAPTSLGSQSAGDPIRVPGRRIRSECSLKTKISHATAACHDER